MERYRAKGGLKKGMAVTLAACFLLGSSITSLAAGDGVTEAYEKLAEYTSDYESMGVEEAGLFTVDVSEDISDEEVVQLLSGEWDVDPDKIVMTGDDLDIMPYSDSGPIHITWYVPADTTYMSSGFKAEIGDEIHFYVYGDPDDVKFWTGIKDPKAKMWYVEGEGIVEGIFYVTIKGRHYFFVSNLSEDTELHVEAYIFKIPKKEVEEGDEEGEGDDGGEGEGGEE